MKEKQYNKLYTYPRQKFGLMVNQCWQDDPKMVGVHMARYKFAAKMLHGKRRIAEIGSADGMYSSIVQNINQDSVVDLYDFDPAWYQEQPNTITHDITHSPLPYAPYDAVYCLDVFEHIKPEAEDIFLKNIVLSLDASGVFIIGIPSLESQKYASPMSREGHVNCKSGDDLRAVLLKHFQNAFIFGMNDETIHTGFLPMSHYLMAICSK